MKKYLITCLCCLLALPVWANQLKSLRVAPSQEKTRVVFDLSSTPDYTYSFSTQPPRLTVELNSVTATRANLERQGANLGPVIRAIHPDNAGTGSRMRLVFELNGAVKPQIFTLRPQQQYGHRLVVDARGAPRFRGEESEPRPGVRAGHMPGAVNLPYASLIDNGHLLPLTALQPKVDAVLDGEVGPIFSCGSGVTACHNLLALEIAGIKGARLYPGSWSEWCADPHRPVAIGD